MAFDQLGLSLEILRAIHEQGYTDPTPIQEKAIPPILDGKDIMGGAQTGTGKTASFILPMLHRLQPYANTSMSPAKHPIRSLILVPTRELAAQVFESVKTYGKYLSLKSTVVYGGVSIDHQTTDLHSGVEILVATPGRMLDHIQQKTIRLSRTEILILDEADRMLDMGFLPDIRRILALLPHQRQSLMFSATFPKEIKSLANSILKQPILIEVAKQNSVSSLVSHVIHPVDQKKKQELLTYLIKSQNLVQILIFMRTKHGANKLARELEKDNISSTAIHGDKSQPQRIQALEKFKQGKVCVLVATDVAARGLDIEDLPHVINFELPNTPEDYIHRIGRTGRAGTKGCAISLVSNDEKELLESIERLLKFKLTEEIIPGFEPVISDNLVNFTNKPYEREHRSKAKDRKNSKTNRKNTNKTNSRPNYEINKHNKEKKSTMMPQDPLFSQPYVPLKPYSTKDKQESGTTIASLSIIKKQSYPHPRNVQKKKSIPALFMPFHLDKAKQDK